MANRDRREALRGAEKETFDLFAEILTPHQWAELLRAPLERAAAKGNRGLAQKLVGGGAEIGDALHEAVRGGHGGVVNGMLESGASVLAKDRAGHGYTALHVAETAEMVQLLLVKGADKDAVDNNAFTPLCLAAFNGHVAPARALLDSGADFSLRCGYRKNTMLHAAARGGHVGILNAAILRGAEVDAIDSIRCTPLQNAARHNKVKAVDVLVEIGANIEARNRGGCTPLHRAALGSSLEAMLALSSGMVRMSKPKTMAKKRPCTGRRVVPGCEEPRRRCTCCGDQVWTRLSSTTPAKRPRM